MAGKKKPGTISYYLSICSKQEREYMNQIPPVFQGAHARIGERIRGSRMINYPDFLAGNIWNIHEPLFQGGQSLKLGF